MDINRENYELWMLGFMEGTLSESEEDKVRNFLLINPDLVDKEDDIRPVYLEPEEIIYQHKEQLKKIFPGKDSRLSKSNFEMFAIAYLENDLNPSQIKEFENFLNHHPDLQKEFELWSKVRLAKENIPFPLKHQLKKPVGRRIISLWMLTSAAVAASIAVLFLVFSNTRMTETVADLDEIKEMTDPYKLSETTEANEEIIFKNQFEIAEKEKTSPPESFVHAGREIQKRSELDFIETASNETGESMFIDTEIENIPASLPVRISLNNHTMSAFIPEPDRIRPLNLPVDLPGSDDRSGIRFAGANMEEVMKNFADRDLSLWSIASSGIEGINRFVGSDMELMASRSEEGEISYFQFSSKRLKIMAPVPTNKSFERR